MSLALHSQICQVEEHTGAVPPGTSLRPSSTTAFTALIPSLQRGAGAFPTTARATVFLTTL